MSHDHHHSHGGGHDHSHDVAVEEEAPPSRNAQRYELEDLFRGEAPENQQFIKIAGIVILVVLLALALSFPFLASGK